MSDMTLYTWLGVSLIGNCLLSLIAFAAICYKPRPPKQKIEVEVIQKPVPAASLPSTVDALAQAAAAEADCQRLASAIEASIRRGWPFEPEAMEALSAYRRRKGEARVKSPRLN